MNDLLTNGIEIKQRIISEISKADSCVYIAMAYFTDREIAKAIINAKNKNLIVDVILSSNAQNETVKLMLRGAGISVHAFETGDYRGIMHHKFCLIDNRISINGSYNYSINASLNNVENVQIADDSTTYSQFLTEFERLKYNIDHNLDVNETIRPLQPTNAQNRTTSIFSAFSEQLNNLVFSAVEIDTTHYKQKGFQNSKETKGSINIFRAEYDSIREVIKVYATDEGLGSKKNMLISNIYDVFENTKNSLDLEKVDKISIEKRNYDLERQQIKEKITNLLKEKSILESGNLNTGEKGLLQINTEIEKNKLERETLEQSFVLSKFWSFGSILAIFGLCVFTGYLSLFFGSAIYKVFFESNIIRSALEAGANPAIPQLVDANAIIKIFKQQGTLFGLIAAFFFLIPVLMSNLKILGNKKKILNMILFWVALLVFDILVSTMVAINTADMKSLLIGKESTLKIWEVVKLGEFWLIFLFGMFPLLLTHYLIDFIYSLYRNSRREIVDSEKNKRIKSLGNQLIDLNTEKEFLNRMLNEKNKSIDERSEEVIQLEVRFNDQLDQINNRYTDTAKQIENIYDNFLTKIRSGIIFTDVILDSVVTAYKLGFIEFLPSFYSPAEVSHRVIEIENSIKR